MKKVERQFVVEKHGMALKSFKEVYTKCWLGWFMERGTVERLKKAENLITKIEFNYHWSVGIYKLSCG